MIKTLLRQQQGGLSLLLVIAFMTVSVPLVTGGLDLASSLSTDSRVKTNIL